MLWMFKLAARITVWRLRLAGFRMTLRERAGGRLAVYHGGGGGNLPLLVLVHGMGDWVGGWRRVLKALNSDYEILAFDLPGYGFSRRDPGSAVADLAQMGEALREVLEAVKPRSFVLVGQSLGGWVALREATAGLPGLSRLVLVNPAGAPAANIDDTRKLLVDVTPEGQRRIRRAVYGRRIPWRQYFLAPLYRRARTLPGFAGFVKSLTGRQLLQSPAAPPPFPMELIFGAQDGLFGAASRDWFTKKYPAARVRLCGFAHAPQMQAPKELAALLRELKV